MERRETYDPEDIESLLNERSFDELLAEERAFVLRHLTGREEYEAMRTLLQQVRTEEQGPHEPIAADPHIREHLLKVYRDRQMPGWRIWLNSVQAFLLPGEAKAFWRPALAIATVLLLVTGGVFVYQRLSTSENTMVAALEEKKESAPPPVAEPAETPATDVPVAAQSATAAATDAGAGIVREQPSPLKTADDMVKDLTADWTVAGEADEALAERKKVEANNEGYNTVTLDASGSSADSLVAFTPGSANYVQLEDLAEERHADQRHRCRRHGRGRTPGEPHPRGRAK